MNVFARHKNELRCMDLACVDKLSKDVNGVKCLPINEDMFDGNVDAKRMEIKNTTESI